MKKFLSTLLIGSMLSMSLPAFADPTPALPEAPALVAGEPDVGAAVSPMKKGQTAPFTGVLLSPRAVATVTVNLQSIEEKIKIEVNRATELAKVKCDADVNAEKIKAEADTKVFQAQLEARNAELKILTDRLEKEEKAKPNLLLWTGGGVLGGVLLTVLVVHATK